MVLKLPLPTILQFYSRFLTRKKLRVINHYCQKRMEQIKVAVMKSALNSNLEINQTAGRLQETKTEWLCIVVCTVASRTFSFMWILGYLCLDCCFTLKWITNPKKERNELPSDNYTPRGTPMSCSSEILKWEPLRCQDPVLGLWLKLCGFSPKRYQF